MHLLIDVLLFGITGKSILYQRLWRICDLCQLGSVSDHGQYDKMHEMILYSYSGGSVICTACA